MALAERSQGFFRRILGNRQPVNAIAGIGGTRLHAIDVPTLPGSRPDGRRASATPTLPRPKEVTPSPTEEPAKEVRKGKRRSKLKIALGMLAGLGIIETTGAVVEENINDKPASIQTIGTDLLWPAHVFNHYFRDSSEASTVNPIEPFDSGADRQVVKAGVNTMSASEEELRKAYRKQSTQNTDGRPTVIFPVKFTRDGQKVDYEYKAPFSPFTDGTLIERPGTIKTNLDRGIEIIVPAENAEVFRFKPEIIDGKEYFIGVFIKWQQNGDTYGFGVSSNDVRTFVPIGQTINAPLVPTNEGGTLLLSEAKDGMRLPLGTSIARVDSNAILDILDVDEGFSFSRYNPDNPHVNGRWESIRPNFVTDNSTGKTKLMLPQ